MWSLLLQIDTSGNDLKFQVVLLGIFLFLTTSVTFLLFLLVSKNAKRKQDKIDIWLKTKSDILLNNVMFSDVFSDEMRTINDLFLSSNYNMQFLITEIRLIHKQLSGEIALKLSEYYSKSKLIELSLNKLNSSDTGLIIQGVDELTEMRVVSSIEQIAFLFEKADDDHVKEHLLMAILNLDPDKGLDLIYKTDKFLTEWEQLNIIQLLERMGHHKIPALDHWLDKNESLILFGCRLVSLTQSYEDVPTLIEMLDHPNDRINVEAIRSLTVLGGEEVEKSLVQSYPPSSLDVKKEILEGLLKFKNPNSIPFVVKCALTEPYELQLLAIKTINSSDNTGKVLEELVNEGHPGLNGIIEHVHDDRI